MKIDIDLVFKTGGRGLIQGHCPVENGDVIDNLEQIIAGFDEERFQNMSLSENTENHLEYFVTRCLIQLIFPVSFRARYITVYEISQR